MTLADSSAWIEYLRRSESMIDLRVDALLHHGGLATTEPVAMELLAGARDNDEHLQLRRMLGGVELLPVEGFADYEAAAQLQRRCRSAEAAVRSIIDCLIAAVAIRNGVALLHQDRDFELIARHSSLQIAG